MEQHVEAGGTISAHAVAEQFGWLLSSAQDALMNLAAAGYLHKAGEEPRTRRTIYELAGPDEQHTKACGACDEVKPEGEFFFSRASPDGLTSICRACVRANAERDRREREARRRPETHARG